MHLIFINIYSLFIAFMLTNKRELVAHKIWKVKCFTCYSFKLADYHFFSAMLVQVKLHMLLVVFLTQSKCYHTLF